VKINFFKSFNKYIEILKIHNNLSVICFDIMFFFKNFFKSFGSSPLDSFVKDFTASAVSLNFLKACNFALYKLKNSNLRFVFMIFILKKKNIFI